MLLPILLVIALIVELKVIVNLSLFSFLLFLYSQKIGACPCMEDTESQRYIGYNSSGCIKEDYVGSFVPPFLFFLFFLFFSSLFS